MTRSRLEMEGAVLSLLAAQDRAWGEGDATAFAAAALPDIVFTNVVGLFSIGVAPFIAQHAHIFSTIFKASRLAQRLVNVTMATDDVAIVDSLTSVTGYQQLPPGAAAIDGIFQTRLEQVLVRRSGALRVQSFHNTPVHPAAAAAARPAVGCAPGPYHPSPPPG